MANAEIKSSNYVISVEIGGENVPVGVVKDPSLTDGKTDIDVSHNADMDVRRISGRRDVELSFSAFYVEDDTGFTFIKDTYDNETEVLVKITETIKGTPKRYADFTVQQFDVTAPNNGAVEGAVTMRRNGAWTII